MLGSEVVSFGVSGYSQIPYGSFAGKEQAINLPAPLIRVLAVKADNRIYPIPENNRILAIHAQDRDDE